MARTATALLNDPSPESLVPALPADFTFTVSENVPIPETAGRTRATQHAFAVHYDTMGHNSSFFVPLAYFLGRPAGANLPKRTIESTPLSKVRDLVQATFVAWKRKGTEVEVEAKRKWRLVTVARELGQDPEYAQMAGVRAWKVDTTR